MTRERGGRAGRHLPRGPRPGAPSVPRRPDDMQALAQQTLRCSVDAYRAGVADAAATGAFGNASRAGARARRGRPSGGATATTATRAT